MVLFCFFCLFFSHHRTEQHINGQERLYILILFLFFLFKHGGPKFVISKSAEDEEEDRILSDYLSHCTLENHQLSLPAEDTLRKGFDCLFYRATQEDIYSYDAEDEEEESFTIHFLYEEGWETDTSEKIGLVKQKQVCYLVL